MSPGALDLLLEKLTVGDLVASERVFAAFEPYLRVIVRRRLPQRLRAKFDSGDVVQSVWVRLLRSYGRDTWSFANVDQLRGFLVRITQNCLTDRLRHFQPALEKEQRFSEGAGEPAADQPRPSELVRAEELWQQMLALCPPEHQHVLRLKRQGLDAGEIAVRTGLHPGSVRRLLRQLARQMACAEPSLPGTSPHG